VGHEFVQPVAAQTGMSTGHVFPQPPQFIVESALVSQPSSGLVLQWAHPLAQPVGAMTHVPARHWTLADDARCTSAVQS
jgi:hypothetical protein